MRCRIQLSETSSVITWGKMKFNILILLTVCCSWHSCWSFLRLVPSTSRLVDRQLKPYSCHTTGLYQFSAKNQKRNNFIQTLKAVPIFHPADDVAVVVSSVYWDNLKGKCLILLGVQFALILVGMALLGTIANQLPNFLSSMVREDSNETLAVNASSRVLVFYVIFLIICYSYWCWLFAIASPIKYRWTVFHFLPNPFSSSFLINNKFLALLQVNLIL